MNPNPHSLAGNTCYCDTASALIAVLPSIAIQASVWHIEYRSAKQCHEDNAFLGNAAGHFYGNRLPHKDTRR